MASLKQKETHDYTQYTHRATYEYTCKVTYEYTQRATARVNPDERLFNCVDESQL